MLRTFDAPTLGRPLPRAAIAQLRPQGMRPLRGAPGARNAPGLLRTARPRAIARI